MRVLLYVLVGGLVVVSAYLWIGVALAWIDEREEEERNAVTRRVHSRRHFPRHHVSVSRVGPYDWEEQ
ncbi:MAG: hypothetical protein KGL39_04215 [Patescibacteria group bacterium]|nr:hypothetical protein [Patescibacteria group bacterium]